MTGDPSPAYIETSSLRMQLITILVQTFALPIALGCLPVQPHCVVIDPYPVCSNSLESSEPRTL